MFFFFNNSTGKKFCWPKLSQIFTITITYLQLRITLRNTLKIEIATNLLEIVRQGANMRLLSSAK